MVPKRSRSGGSIRCAAPSTCSGSIWQRSTCARTATCTKRSSPSFFARARVTADYAALAEDSRVALLVRELANPRPLHSPHLAYSDRVDRSLRSCERAAEIRAASAPTRCRTT
jgi:phosphoenolpyruvate carboxylase